MAKPTTKSASATAEAQAPGASTATPPESAASTAPEATSTETSSDASAETSASATAEAQAPTYTVPEGFDPCPAHLVELPAADTLHGFVRVVPGSPEHQAALAALESAPASDEA
ncbi:hypothetical protein J421_4664 (plasmid) [Gemmatirosa kalamazoonensis]|uniref:Uncharacterized protein n=1 Tax=Gemmatirosa kalamazoonensis TaxID=861299 RepID=W0RMX8_9BACT|nr:hypothetical protein [Gemmatirosa kalamazoonensis]AHG92131.1 hypothetical protein J421_4596 [Gemmatirosa kalamazoonensis]AHG92199.1 hypothetical protein J421_4664 [Gemmatirosa kalamazoonensis]